MCLAVLLPGFLSPLVVGVDPKTLAQIEGDLLGGN